METKKLPLTLVLKQATVVDSNSPFNNKKVDILIDKGIITKIAKSIPQGKAPVFEAKNLHVSPGWFDMRVNFSEPGHEQKETLESGTKAAAAGGFTGVLHMPSTKPALQNKSSIQFIKNNTAQNIVDVHVAGAISDNLKGDKLNELFDMHQAGAIAFTDDKHSHKEAGFLLRALQYVKNFNGLIMAYSQNKSISKNGQVHEGQTSTELGLKGIPELAEEIDITRNIQLNEYAESKLHLGPISTKNSCDLIKAAKGKQKLSADVAIHNLALTDSQLETFDSNYKVLPPLRDEKNRKALLKALKAGSIDVICSDHTPQDVEHKKLEFENANYGIIGIQTLFSLAIEHVSEVLSLPEIIEKISHNPRTILGLAQPKIKEGEKANLTLFNPSLQYTFEKDTVQSLSFNSPFIGKTLTGKALGIINKGLLHS